MSGNEARNDLRRLLAESGVDPSPELLEALHRLQDAGTGQAPEPQGELAELLDRRTRLRSVDGPKGSRQGSPRRGFLLTAALIGAMAAGTSGVAATLRDHQVTADVADTASQPAPMEQVPGAEQAEEPDTGTSAAGPAGSAPASEESAAGSTSVEQAEESASQPAPAAADPAPAQPAPATPETSGPAPAPAAGATGHGTPGHGTPGHGGSARPDGAGQGAGGRPAQPGSGNPHGPDRTPGAGQRPGHAADRGSVDPGSAGRPGSSWADPGAAKGPRTLQENRGGARPPEAGPPEHSAVYGGRSGLGR